MRDEIAELKAAQVARFEQMADRAMSLKGTPEFDEAYVDSLVAEAVMRDEIRKLESYRDPKGLNLWQINKELRTVYVRYPEYHDRAYGPGTFSAMVEKFAEDDFYYLHFVAKAFKELVGPARDSALESPLDNK